MDPLHPRIADHLGASVVVVAAPEERGRPETGGAAAGGVGVTAPG